MDILEVYHAGVDIVKYPDVKRGRPELDFGQGFYLTDVYDQAVNWAVKKGLKFGRSPIINKYILRRADILTSPDFNSKVFTAYDEEWFDFIVGNRSGNELWRPFDYIEGGLADDRIVTTVDLYFTGNIDRTEAIKRLKIISPNNQICLLNQTMLDSFLEFVGFTTIE